IHSDTGSDVDAIGLGWCQRLRRSYVVLTLRGRLLVRASRLPGPFLEEHLEVPLEALRAEGVKRLAFVVLMRGKTRIGRLLKKSERHEHREASRSLHSSVCVKRDHNAALGSLLGPEAE